MNKTLIFFFSLILFVNCTGFTPSEDTGNLDMRAYMTGKSIYERECSSCHGVDAEGYGNLYPTLDDSTLYHSSRNYLPCIIRHGIKKNKVIMPGFEYLDFENTADLINFLIEEYGSEKRFYSSEEIKQIVHDCGNQPASK